MSEFDGKKKLAELTGVPEEVIDSTLQWVKENHARLKSCPGPHDFSREYKRGVSRRVQCLKCRGTVDLNQKMWYELGLKHAGLDRKK